MKTNKQASTDLVNEGPIIEWEQDHWWQEGKSRLKEEKQPFFKTPKGIGISVFVIIVILSLGLLIFIASRKKTVNPELNEQEEQTQDLGLTSLQQQIKQLRAQLLEADPAIKDTPLPQVEMNIIITEE